MLTYRLTIILHSLVQESIEIEAWRLLTFFLCLHNQFSYIDSIVTYKRAQKLEKDNSQIDRK